MINKTTLLGCALLGATGYLVATHWDDIRLKLGIDDPTELRAMHIAKSAFSLAPHAPNHLVIQEHMDSVEGMVVVGWQAERQNESLYLVTFVYEEDGERQAYSFEVNVGSTRVRHIEAEPDLAEKYGIEPRAVPRPR